MKKMHSQAARRVIWGSDRLHPLASKCGKNAKEDDNERSNAEVTEDDSKVTCVRCIKRNETDAARLETERSDARIRQAIKDDGYLASTQRQQDEGK